MTAPSVIEAARLLRLVEIVRAEPRTEARPVRAHPRHMDAHPSSEADTWLESVRTMRPAA